MIEEKHPSRTHRPRMSLFYQGMYPPPPPSASTTVVYNYYGGDNNPRRRCWCCPRFAPFFICSRVWKVNTSFWSTVFMLLHGGFCLRDWGQYYSGIEDSSLMTTFLHGALAFVYIQSNAEGVRPGPMLVMCSIIALSVRILQWN